VVRDDLAAGAHWVVAAAPGHRARGALVELDPDGPTSARLSLVLPARAPAERIGELRRQLGGATGDDARRAAGELARLAGAAVLVLVRERGDRTEGASFDARTGALSAWQPAPSDAFTRQIAGGPVPLAPAPAAGAPLLLGGSTDGEPDRDPSWYGTWWGRTLLVAGGVVIAGAVVYAVTSGRDGDYAVGGFCFDGVDC
jgi:hypothetical protein